MMKKRIQGVVLGCVLCAGLPATASANELMYNANIAMVTKYVWRGWLLNHDLSAQGSFDVSYGGLYGSIWGGTDENLGTEYDLVVGYGGEFNEDWFYDVGFVQYRYPNKDVENNEAHLTLGWRWLSATYHRGEDDYEYVEFNASFELNEKFTLDLHVGHEDAVWREWYDLQVMLNYQIDDNYSVFIAASDKEDRDEQFWAGVKGAF